MKPKMTVIYCMSALALAVLTVSYAQYKPLDAMPSQQTTERLTLDDAFAHVNGPTSVSAYAYQGASVAQ